MPGLIEKLGLKPGVIYGDDVLNVCPSSHLSEGIGFLSQQLGFYG
jgi:hypothetical protein